jgi:uncharacterized protein (DUF433 family)
LVSFSDFNWATAIENTSIWRTECRAGGDPATGFQDLMVPCLRQSQFAPILGVELGPLAMSHSLTTAQAAFVVGEPLEVFKKAVERAPVKPRIVKRGGHRIRQFGLADLVFLHAYSELKQELTPKSQAALYQAMLVAPPDRLRSEVVFGNQKYNVRHHVQVIESKMKELEKLEGQIDTSGREAVIKGTRIEAHRIAALLDGEMTAQEVLRDYPSLSENQILAAKAFAEANPKIGRPYPPVTAKYALRTADLGVLDDGS